MEANTKGTTTLKKLSPTYIIICVYYLLSGIEYAVILPTLNMYLLSLNAESFFIGLVMASFSLAGLISAPIYGRIYDITGSTKTAVILSNLFEIGGNFMYFSAINPYMILGSRLIAGLGSGSGSAIMGMISRNTSNDERTAAFSHLMALRQIGLIIGPAFNLFLRKIHFTIGPFQVNPFTVPGLFMALLWAVHTVLVILFYKELNTESKARSKSIEDDCFEGTDSLVASEAAAASSSYQEASIEEIRSNIQRRDRAPSQFFTYVYNDLLREEVIVCLAINFTVMFIQTGLETLLTPLTLELFGWGELPNSIFFCIAGVLIVTSFFVLALLSKKLSDRVLLVGGLIVMVLVYATFASYISFAVESPVGTAWVIAIFSIQSGVLVLDLPFVWVPQASLFSKITSERTQGFNQGIRMLIMRIGQILGPLWAASLLDRLEITICVNLGLVLLILIMVLASYKQLDVPEESSDETMESSAVDVSERTRLLSTRSASILA